MAGKKFRAKRINQRRGRKETIVQAESVMGKGTKITELPTQENWDREHQFEVVPHSQRVAGSEAYEAARPFPPRVLHESALVWMDDTSIIDTPFGDLPGSVGDYYSTPDSLAVSIRQSIKIVIDLAADDWTPLVILPIIEHGYAGGSRSWFVDLVSAGAIRFVFSADGTNQAVHQSIALGLADGERALLAVEYDPIALTVQFYLNGVAHGPAQSTTIASLFDNAIDVTVGAGNPSTATFAGKIYSAQIYKGIPGSTFDPYVNLNGTGGTVVTTPNTVGSSIRGSITLEADVAMTDWNTTLSTLVGKQLISGNRGYEFVLQTSKRLSLFITSNGTNVVAPITAAMPFLAGERHTVRVEWNPITGIADFYTDGTLFQSVAAVLPYLVDTDSEVGVGARYDGNGEVIDGIIYDAKVYKGIPGSPVDAYVRLDGVAGTYVSVPDSPALSIIGDIDIEIDLSLDDYTPASIARILTKSITSGQYSYSLEMQTDGKLRFRVSVDGTALISYVPTNATGLTDGTRHRIRVTRDATTGDADFYHDDVFIETIAGTAGAINDGTDEIRLGDAAIGTIYGAIIKSDIGSSDIRLDMNPVDYIQGDSTFQSPNFSEVFTLEGNAVAVASHDDGLKVHMSVPSNYLQATPTFDSDTETWTLEGNAIANAPGDDGLKASFVAEDSAGVDPWSSALTGEEWTGNGNVDVIDYINWINMGTGLSPYDLTVAVDTVANLAITDQTPNGLNAIVSSGSAGLRPAAAQVITSPYVIFIVGSPAAIDAARVAFSSYALETSRAEIGHDGSEYIAFQGTTDLTVAGAVTTPRVFTADLRGDATSIFTVSRYGNVVGDAGADALQYLSFMTDYLDARDWIGWIGEVAIFDFTLSTSEKKYVTDYLEAKWLQPITGAEILEGAIAWFNEDNIVSSGGIVTEWPNQGIGGSDFDLDTVVGTAGNLTVMPKEVARLVGAAGDYFSTPDSVLNSVAGDIDIRWYGSLDDWIPVAGMAFVSKYIASGGQFAWTLQMRTDGALSLIGSFDGAVTETTTATVTTGFTNGALGGVRVTKSAASGDVTFYTSTDGVIWTQIGTVVSGTASGFFDSTAAIYLGASNNGNSPLLGYCHSAQVYDGIDGTLAVNFNPTQAPAAQTAWTDTLTAAVWTPQGDAFVNTTGKDVVNAAGLVGIETTSAQNLTVPYTILAVAKFTEVNATEQCISSAKAGIAGDPSIRMNAGDNILFSTSAAAILAGAGDTDPHVFMALQNGDATSKFNVSGFADAVGDAGPETYNFASLFMNANNADFTRGWIGEFIVFDRALTDEEIRVVQLHLEEKWT